MTRIAIIILILLTGFTNKVSAIFDTIDIKEVSVIAQRAMENRGLNLTLIDSSVIQSHITGSLSDLLVSNSTVFMKTYGQGALSTISFRGTSASHTKVKWNGIPLNNPMLGQVDFSLIPVNFTDQISLLHGGSSLQDGAGALGGAIILQSAPSWNDPYTLSLTQGIGSFGTYRSHANLQIGRNRVRMRMKFFTEQSENNFEYYNTENGLWSYEIQENADYKKHGVLGEIFIKADNRNFVSLHTWIQNSLRNIPAIMSYEGGGRTEYQSDDQVRISGIWKNYGVNYRSEITVGYISSGIDYYLANQTGMGLFVNFNSASKAQNLIGSHKITADLGDKIVLKTKLDYQYSTAHISEEESLIGYEASRQEVGLSLSMHREFGKYLTMFGLLRGELADATILPLMPSLGMEIHMPQLNMKVISNLARNYSLPTLNDQYWIPGGNPDLKPEEGYSGDLSISHTLKKNKTVNLSMTLTGFASTINDWILWRPGEYSYWTAENIARVFARGVEYTVRGIYAPGELTFGLNATYAFTRTTNKTPVFENDLSVDQQLIYIPIHKANASLSAGYKSYHLMTSLSYTGERFTTSSNEETRHTLPEFTLLDIRTGKDFSFKRFNATIQLKINNLFNKNYKAILSRPMPGRSWEVVLRFEI